ncbi:MAG: hypothetical protein Q9174_001981 [Haloplaca sp. 1 TL-2023]
MDFSSESAANDTAAPILTSLESWVSHLVASKRSLSSIEHVLRANEIVTLARAHLETSVITSSRTSFIRTAMAAQLRTLDTVHEHSKAVELEGAEEYKEVLRTVEEADQRLNDTLDRLRTTIVETSLRPETDQRKSLLDFVDECGVDQLLSSVQESANAAQEAHAELIETNSNFQNDIDRVWKLLEKSRTPNRPFLNHGTSLEGSDYGELSQFSLPDILQNMDDRAKDMADNLESLVNHFDLCVTAIRHTEGGGDAARRMADDLPASMDVGEAVAGPPPEPISEEEKHEMLEILAKDADQVDEVVAEIREHIGEMEIQLNRVNAYVSQLDQESADTTKAFQYLDGMGTRLHAFVAQSQVFAMRWDDEKAKINEKMDELESLGHFYAGYVTAYDHLLVEIGRRQFMEQQMDKVLQEAMRRLDVLHEEDSAKREAFKSSYGDFLPVDIWPGLTNAPLRFDAQPVNGIEKVPDISKSVIQRAIRRVEGKA